MALIRTWLEPYDLDTCPRCGNLLEPVDVNLNRHCSACRLYITPQVCELHDDYPPED